MSELFTTQVKAKLRGDGAACHGIVDASRAAQRRRSDTKAR